MPLRVCVGSMASRLFLCTAIEEFLTLTITLFFAPFFTVGKSCGKELSSIPGMLSDEGEEEMETTDISEGLCLNMFSHWMDHY